MAVWGAAITGAVALGSAVMQKNAQSKGLAAQKNASNAALGEQAREFDTTQTNQQPFLQAGANAVGQMQQLNNGDFSSFEQSPDYQYAVSQQLQGLDRSAASRGSLYSGGHSADIMNMANGIASQNYNSYYNKLAGLAGSGQTSANNLGYTGQANANQSGQIMTNQGNNAANSYQNGANTMSQLGGAIGGIFNNTYQNNRYGQMQDNMMQPTNFNNSLGGGWTGWNVGTAGRG